MFITHKLREVLACADRVAVMRQGRIVDTLQRSTAREATLLRLMFGEASVPRPAAGRTAAPGEIVLALDGVATAPEAGSTALRDLSLTLRGGEILGVAGVSGNGQRELAELILGLRRPVRGLKRLWGENANDWPIATIRARGVASIPDDPLAFAAIPGFTVRENFALGSGKRYRAGLGVDWPRLVSDMGRSAAQLGFPSPAFETRAAVLSGGNLQRVVLTRELAHNPPLIVALYPTRGLDTRSTDAVCAALGEASARGAAVLFASVDLDELFAVCDRLVVLREGRIAGTFMPDAFRTETVGPAMVGVADAA